MVRPQETVEEDGFSLAARRIAVDFTALYAAVASDSGGRVQWERHGRQSVWGRDMEKTLTHPELWPGCGHRFMPVSGTDIRSTNGLLALASIR